MLFVAAVLIAPGVSHPAYSSLAHTTSELAGQNMPAAWMMRLGFMGFGLGVAVASLARWQAMPTLASATLLFGLCMVAAAVWSHLPIDPSLGGSTGEDGLHSLAATAMGFAFAAAVATRLWQQRGRGHWLDWMAVAAAVPLPLGMAALPTMDGALQRTMFAISFLWLWQVLASD